MTFIRRPRLNRRGIGENRRGGVAPLALRPLSIISSVPVLQYAIADVGLEVDALWEDQSSGGFDYTGSDWPTLDEADATLNNRATLTFDGTGESLTSGLELVAPATTPTWIWMIFAQVTWTNNDVILSDLTGSRITVAQSNTTPTIFQANGSGNVNPNTALPADSSWARGEFYFSDSAGVDYVKLRGTTVQTSAVGPGGVGTGRNIARNAAGTVFANMKLAAIMYCAGLPTAPERAALDAWVTTYYGAGLTEEGNSVIAGSGNQVVAGADRVVANA